MARAFFEFTKRVDETAREHPGKILPLLVREARVAPVRLRIREIDFRVRHVEIAAENHRLRAFQRLEVLQKIAIPNVLNP